MGRLGVPDPGLVRGDLLHRPSGGDALLQGLGRLGRARAGVLVPLLDQEPGPLAVFLGPPSPQPDQRKSAVQLRSLQEKL